jgi:ABC-type glycerol-3-phosphate transport system substrate-binding protein
MRRLTVTAIIAILSLCAAGCTADGETGAVAAPVRIEVAAAWSGTEPGSEQDRFLRVLDEFTKQTGVVVDYTTIPRSELTTTLQDRSNNNSAPDVAMLPEPAFLRSLACQGALKPLPAGVQQVIADNYAVERRTPGMYNDQLFGVWFKAANKSLIWYNAEVLQLAGVTKPPSTWAELIDAAAKIGNFGVTPISLAGKLDSAWVLTDWFENVYLRTAGPALYDRLAGQDSPRLSWTDPSVTTALQRLDELWAHQSSLIVGGPQGALDVTYEQSVANVFSNKVGAMVFEGDFVAAQIATLDPKPESADVQFFPFPSPESVVAGGDIAVMTKDSAGAQRLLSFLASSAAALVWAREGGFISPNRNVPVDVYPDDGVSRPAARAWAEATQVRFDLSDQLPPDLGSGPKAGLWYELHNYLANPDATAFAQRMEAAAQLHDNTC